MSGMDYRISGRRVSGRDFFKGIEKEVMAMATKDLRNKLQSIRDPRTGERLKVTEVRRPGRPPDFKVSGPEALVKQASKLLKR